MLKKFLAIIFCSLFLYQSVGYIFFYQFQQVKWQLAVWKNISEEKNQESISLILPVNDTRIERLNKHEIVFEGKQYDVKEVKTENAVTQLYCYRDSNEEQLIGKLIAIFKTTDSKKQSSSPLTELFSKNFQKVFCNENLNNRTDVCFFFAEQIYSLTDFQKLYERHISTPPPKTIA